MGVTLLDVNVLIALAWPNHVHHAPARKWFSVNGVNGWATTPVTELGFVRVSSNRKAIPSAVSPASALQGLAALCRLPGHQFWPDGNRLLEPPFDLDRLAAHAQVTDVHLVALAAAHAGRLATFDRRICNSVDAGRQGLIELLALD